MSKDSIHLKNDFLDDFVIINIKFLLELSNYDKSGRTLNLFILCFIALRAGKKTLTINEMMDMSGYSKPTIIKIRKIFKKMRIIKTKKIDDKNTTILTPLKQYIHSTKNKQGSTENKHGTEIEYGKKTLPMVKNFYHGKKTLPMVKNFYHPKKNEPTEKIKEIHITPSKKPKKKNGVDVASSSYTRITNLFSKKEKKGDRGSGGKGKIKNKNGLEFFPLNYQQDFSFQEAWSDWVQYRKEIKKTLVPSTIKRQVNQLTKKIAFNPKEAVKIIDQTITRGWIGLYGLETKNKNEYPKNSEETDLSKYDNMKQTIINNDDF